MSSIDDFAFYDALLAKSEDAQVVAQHNLALSFGARANLVIVPLVPGLQVLVTSEKVTPRLRVPSWPHASVALSASIRRRLQPPTA